MNQPEVKLIKEHLAFCPLTHQECSVDCAWYVVYHRIDKKTRVDTVTGHNCAITDLAKSLDSLCKGGISTHREE